MTQHTQKVKVKGETHSKDRVETTGRTARIIFPDNAVGNNNNNNT